MSEQGAEEAGLNKEALVDWVDGVVDEVTQSVKNEEQIELILEESSEIEVEIDLSVGMQQTVEPEPQVTLPPSSLFAGMGPAMQAGEMVDGVVGEVAQAIKNEEQAELVLEESSEVEVEDDLAVGVPQTVEPEPQVTLSQNSLFAGMGAAIQAEEVFDSVVGEVAETANNEEQVELVLEESSEVEVGIGLAVGMQQTIDPESEPQTIFPQNSLFAGMGSAMQAKEIIDEEVLLQAQAEAEALEKGDKDDEKLESGVGNMFGVSTEAQHQADRTIAEEIMAAAQGNLNPIEMPENSPHLDLTQPHAPELESAGQVVAGTAGRLGLGFGGLFGGFGSGVVNAATKLKEKKASFDIDRYNNTLRQFDSSIINVKERALKLADGPLSNLKDNPSLIREFGNPEVSQDIEKYRIAVGEFEDQATKAVKMAKAAGATEEMIEEGITARLNDVEEYAQEKLGNLEDEKGNKLAGFVAQVANRIKQTIEALLNFVKGKGFKSNVELDSGTEPASSASMA